MKVLKNILLVFLILILILTAVAAGYFLYQEKHKTPDEIIELENQKTELAYKENLEYALKVRGQYDFIVVLNPAHGGMDAGYQNSFGAEKDIVLAICRQVMNANVNPDIGIFLTRTTDVGMSDEMRMEFVNQVQPDLFIDVHLSKNTAVSSYGTAVSYKTSYYNRKLTNAVFADIMEKSVVRAIEGIVAGVVDITNENHTLILNEMTIPAVSLVCGNMANEKEGELLSRENYQKNIASGIWDGILQAKEALEQ